MGTNIHKLLFLVLILSACSSNAGVVLDNNVNDFQLPDLVVSFINLAMVDANGRCLQGYHIQVTVSNQGVALAEGINVVELSTSQIIHIDRLEAGESFGFSLPASAAAGNYIVVIDPDNQISELNETNNNLSFISPTPTPPIECITQPPLVEYTPFPEYSPTPYVESVQTDSHALTMPMILNSVYHSADWGDFQLKDGLYYRPPPTAQESPEAYTTRISDPVYYGDINGDNLEDAFVILNTQNGGTGHFKELAVLLDQNGIPLNVSTTYLGDRILLESANVREGIINLYLVIQGVNDPLCCPNEHVVWQFRLEGDQLVKLP